MKTKILIIATLSYTCTASSGEVHNYSCTEMGTRSNPGNQYEFAIHISEDDLYAEYLPPRGGKVKFGHTPVVIHDFDSPGSTMSRSLAMNDGRFVLTEKYTEKNGSDGYIEKYYVGKEFAHVQHTLYGSATPKMGFCK